MRRPLLDIEEGIMRIKDLGHVEVPLRESRGGNAKIKLQETEQKKCLVKSQRLDSKQRGMGKRLHLQFGQCSDRQMINVLDKA